MSGEFDNQIKRGNAEKGALRLAYDVLKEITANDAYSNLALKSALEGVPSKTASRVTALVYTALENISYADYLIAHYAKGRVQGSIKNVLRLGITELIFMDVPDHAAVNGAAELTRDIGKAKLCGFVNGVLRSIARDNAENRLFPLPTDPVERLSVRYGIPKGLADEYIENYALEFAEDMLATRAHELTVRAQYPFTTEALKAELMKRGIAFSIGKYDKNALILQGGNPAELELFKDGKLTVQSESAMLSVRACRVREGMTVLDTCAAPGGKSAYLASLMGNTGAITAWEVHEHRTELLRATLDRLGVTNCVCKTLDASTAQASGEKYDIVLCDAPCSGLGGGGKPDALIRRTDEGIAEIADIQLKILLNAANFVKDGGALVYSTCTVSRRENEGNIERFLENRPDFEPESLAWLLSGEIGENAANAETENAALDEKRGKLGIQLFPNIDGMDGFYIARLIKNGNER